MACLKHDKSTAFYYKGTSLNQQIHVIYNKEYQVIYKCIYTVGGR